VRDRAAKRAAGGALNVDVDPLMVSGRVGERVHLLLGDLVPLAEAQAVALGRDELRQVRKGAHAVDNSAPRRGCKGPAARRCAAGPSCQSRLSPW